MGTSQRLSRGFHRLALFLAAVSLLTVWLTAALIRSPAFAAADLLRCQKKDSVELQDDGSLARPDPLEGLEPMSEGMRERLKKNQERMKILDRRPYDWDHKTTEGANGPGF
jgi:hypothetical protein